MFSSRQMGPILCQEATLARSKSGTQVSCYEQTRLSQSSLSLPSTGTLELKASKKNAHTDTDMFGDTGVTSVAYSPDGSKVVSSGKGGTIKV